MDQFLTICTFDSIPNVIIPFWNDLWGHHRHLREVECPPSFF